MSSAAKLESQIVDERIHGRRFEGILRPYAKADVERLRGSVHIEYTLAKLGAKRLWELLHTEAFVPALGALTGNQAVQMVRAGLKAIYLSGWQVAADANTAGQMYPDQSLYPCQQRPHRRPPDQLGAPAR
jgi:isocitrate lyase